MSHRDNTIVTRGRRDWICALTLAAGVSVASQSMAAQAAAAAQPQAPPGAAQPRAGDAPAATPQSPGATDEAQANAPAGPPAAENAQGQASDDAKLTSTPGSKALGISILGNQEAPTSLVIVPWKTSELGNSVGISPLLDDSRQPVDKDVFMRALRYYEIRSEPARHEGATTTTGGRENAAADSGAARRR
jgi:hypothetical protein